MLLPIIVIFFPLQKWNKIEQPDMVKLNPKYAKDSTLQTNTEVHSINSVCFKVNVNKVMYLNCQPVHFS